MVEGSNDRFGRVFCLYDNFTFRRGSLADFSQCPSVFDSYLSSLLYRYGLVKGRNHGKAHVSLVVEATKRSRSHMDPRLFDFTKVVIPQQDIITSMDIIQSEPTLPSALAVMCPGDGFRVDDLFGCPYLTYTHVY
nr:unnamed protein product [Haemonchus contortus]